MVVSQVKVISAATEGVFFWLLFISVTLYKDFFYCLRVDTLILKPLCVRGKKKNSCECVKRVSELVNRVLCCRFLALTKKVTNVQKSKKIKSGPFT